MSKKSKKSAIHSLPGPDDITRRQLDNGLIVLVRENHALAPS